MSGVPSVLRSFAFSPACPMRAVLLQSSVPLAFHKEECGESVAAPTAANGHLADSWPRFRLPVYLARDVLVEIN